MNLGEVLTALAAFVVIAGAATAMIKILIQISVTTEFEVIKRNIALQETRDYRRINRIERRLQVLELKVLGETDTFGTPE